MKRLLAMDGICEGMFITVMQGIVERHVTPEGIIDIENEYLNGKPLEVMSIDIPYMVVKCHMSHTVSTTTLDMRKNKFMILSKEYVKAYCPKIKIPEIDNSLRDSGLTLKEIFPDNKEL